jgi:hypothetical protein
VVRTDGFLLIEGRVHASWLPDDWTLELFPVSLTPRPLRAWFRYAVDVATEKPWPAPQPLLAHAVRLKRHLDPASRVDEPTAEMTPEECVSFLNNILSSLVSEPAPRPPAPKNVVDEEAAILKVLLKAYPVLMTAEGIADRLYPSVKTVKKYIKSLEKKRLVTKADGKRGRSLTEAGLEQAKS